MKSEQLHENLDALSRNPYPGRGIVIGLDQTGKNMVQVYWIMGRSADSRNRIFGREGGRLFTEPVDPNLVKDPRLIIYNAMNERRPYYIVSNGHQTDDVTARIGPDLSLNLALTNWEYEPDSPNFTPRITGCCSTEDWGVIRLSILRKNGNWCEKPSYHFRFEEAGVGRGITTYSGDGNPLPSFQGIPLSLPLVGDIDKIATTYWNTLNPENRVSLAVKFIRRDGASEINIINRFEKK